MMGTFGHIFDGFKAFVKKARAVGTLDKSVGGFELTITRKSGGVEKYVFPNGSTTQGRNYLFDAAFRNSGTTANWYIGLIDKTSFSGLNVADTAASHAGWIEFDDYDESVRQTWTKAAASGGIINASAASTFTISAVSVGQFLAGAFVTSVNTKGATTGILWATGQFAADIPIQEGDVLNLTYFSQLT